MTSLDFVTAHYARFLGKPTTGYSVELRQHPKGGYDILQYEDVPWEGTVTLATCGLSDVNLHLFRQELILHYYKRYASRQLLMSMAGIVAMITESGHPLLQGEIIVSKPAESLTDDTQLAAFYSAVPSYFPDEFQMIEDGEVLIDIGWLIPIYKTEAEWIERNGWQDFEALLVERDPDVMDLSRPAVTPP